MLAWFCRVTIHEVKFLTSATPIDLLDLVPGRPILHLESRAGLQTAKALRHCGAVASSKSLGARASATRKDRSSRTTGAIGSRAFVGIGLKFWDQAVTFRLLFDILHVQF
jgi:hypothetical protein